MVELVCWFVCERVRGLLILHPVEIALRFASLPVSQVRWSRRLSVGCAGNWSVTRVAVPSFFGQTRPPVSRFFNQTRPPFRPSRKPPAPRATRPRGGAAGVAAVASARRQKEATTRGRPQEYIIEQQRLKRDSPSALRNRGGDGNTHSPCS